MKPLRLILRCYAERVDGQWQAFCLDFSLAAQADSFEEAQAKLESMIREYVHDALTGEDKEYAYGFLTRSAPAKYWAKYYVYAMLTKFGAFRDGLTRLFNETIPLEPVHYNHA